MRLSAEVVSVMLLYPVFNVPANAAKAGMEERKVEFR